MTIRSILLGFLFFFTASRAPALAALPVAPAPPQPFPQILTDAYTSEFIAPGITYHEYAMMTKDGPVDIHVVAVDLHEPTVRFDTVLASDALISSGETPTSMAVRTGAVAGINGDYYDINNTNQPLGIVVRGGQLVRTPNAHGALAITRDRRAIMMPFTYSASAMVGTIPLPLTGINEWPPRDGLTLMTPAFGSLPPAPNVTVAQLTPLDTLGSATSRFRIDSVQPADQRIARGYALAISATASQTLGDPQPGDIVSISQTSAPDFSAFAAAVGGGPLLLQAGSRYSEPNAPAAAEGRSRIPISGAALLRDGTFALVQVDGRQAAHSVGLTRDEFTSLLIALGASDGLSFDGGGSAAIVTRRLGDRRATLRNVPSDGTERAVADGLFIYSDAPEGPPSRLVVHPDVIRALAGAVVSLETAVTDRAGHPIAVAAQPIRASATPALLGSVAGDRFVAGARNASGVLHLSRGALTADVPVHVVDRAARIVITPGHAHAQPGQSVRFSVAAYDASGYPLQLPERLPWSTSAGRITDSGMFTASDHDAEVALHLGNTTIREPVLVGEHDMELQLGQQWRFITVPANGPGALSFGVPCPVCIQLDYDFTDTERDATMIGDRTLPDEAIGLRFDVNGDANNEILRLSLTNAINERVFLTVGKITWQGWQTKEVRFPASLAVPARLHTLYVVNGVGGNAVHVAGAVAFRNIHVILAGKAGQGADTPARK